MSSLLWNRMSITVFVRSASPMCCAPSSSILFCMRLNVLSVCRYDVGEAECLVYCEIRRILPYSFVERPQYVALLHRRFRCEWGGVWWVSADVWEAECLAYCKMWQILPCSSAARPRFVVLLHPQFCCNWGLVWWVSAGMREAEYLVYCEMWRILPRLFAERLRFAVLLYRQFYCNWALVWWVSMLKEYIQICMWGMCSVR